ncbi:GntR family transcriptional regulator [Priestia aryabhattai]
MQIIISNNSKQPIYEQISKQIKQFILKGNLQEGTSLPSIRSLAKDLQVSVITTKRAYEELEREGFIYSLVGKGSFVSAQNETLLKERQHRVVEEKLLEVIEICKDLNVSKDELNKMVAILYKVDDE